MAQVSRLLVNFNLALAQLGTATPPAEHAPRQRALLPICRQMDARMLDFMIALLADELLRADLAWHRLALLVEEAGAVTTMLTLKSQ